MCLTPEERDFYLDRIKKRISSKRFSHTLGVEKTAIALAEKYGINIKKAQIAALFHDYAKTGKAEDPALHGRLAAQMVQEEFGIADQEIKNAIQYHTVGRSNMGDLEMLIYVADMIEPGRNFSGVEKLRKAAWQSLEEGMLCCLVHTICYLVQNRICVDQGAILAYNDIITRRRCKDESSIS